MLYLCGMEYALDTLYHRICRELSRRMDAGEAQAEAFALLEDLFDVRRTDVLMGRRLHVDDAEDERLQRAIEALDAGSPLQYATGRALFCGRYFRVDGNVLIPRPETELLVRLVVGCCPEHVLDCGTGSGCIAVSVALELPSARVEAWDISPSALAVARGNAEVLGAKVDFRECDMLQPPCADGEQYDVIVSNPPYICRSESAEMEAHVTEFEPHLALFVPDDDPLRFYVALANLGLSRLRRGGTLLLECNRRYADAVSSMLTAAGYVRCEVIPDCFGAPRMVRAVRG